MSRRLGAAALALSLLATVGCSVEIAALQVAAVAAGEPAPAPCGRGAGRSCRWHVVGVPLGLPQLEEAMDTAMRPVAGRLMRDVVVTSDHSFYLLFGQNCYTVRGEVYR